jgi:hypothetical protein
MKENIFPKKKKYFYLFSMQLFSEDATMFSIFFFFAHKKLKKPPLKVAYNRPKLFFYSPAQLTAHSPELIFHIIKCREQGSVLLSAIGTPGF